MSKTVTRTPLASLDSRTEESATRLERLRRATGSKRLTDGTRQVSTFNSAL